MNRHVFVMFNDTARCMMLLLLCNIVTINLQNLSIQALQYSRFVIRILGRGRGVIFLNVIMFSPFGSDGHMNSQSGTITHI